MIEPLDITSLEKAWREYKEARKSGSLTDWGLINLTSWMGERTGSVLQEIRMLRTQVKDLQVQMNDIETELQNVYDYYNP